MIYEIVNKATDAATGELYLVVKFWDDGQDPDTDPPDLINDFVMQLRATRQRIVTDGQGQLKLTDGSFIDPPDIDDDTAYDFEFETVDVDVAARVEKNILAYWDRAKKRNEVAAARVSFVDARRQTDRTDPHGVMDKIATGRKEVPAR